MIPSWSSLNKRFGTLLRYSSAAIFLQLANMMSNIVILRWLPPETIGLWQSLLLIGTYAGLAQGGAIHGLNRELPFMMGRNDTENVKTLAGTGHYTALFGSVLCLAGIPIVWIVFHDAPACWGATAILVSTSIHIYRLYLGATYRASREFEYLAKIELAEGVFTLATLPLVLTMGYAGLALRLVLLRAGITALNYMFRPIRTVGHFSWACCKELYVVGIPIFLFGYLSDVAKSMPRLVLLHLGGVLWVGLFAPASAVLGALLMIPASVGRYVYPKMTFRYGKTGDSESLWPIARMTAVWTFVAAIPLAVVLGVSMPHMIRLYFPDYVESIPSVLWTLTSGVFLGASISVNALASLKAFRSMAVVVVIRLTLLGGLSWMGGVMTNSLNGVAAGMAIAYALDFVAVLILIRLATRRSQVID